MNNLPSEADRRAVHEAVSRATRSWLARRRERVDPFCQRHFSLPGALRLNRKGIGWDLLRAPANVLWAVPALAGRGGAALSRRLGLERTATLLARLPPGFKTAVEREVEWLVYCELLELPYRQDNRQCDRDSLFEAVLEQPEVQALLAPQLRQLDELAQREAFEKNLEGFLRTYTASRTAAAELSGALLNLAAGAAAFQKFTPGSLAIGSSVATAIAQHLAIGNFALGSTLGGLYYGMFPASASAGLLVGTIGGVMVALGILTAVAGVVADPVQQALGLHRRKLHRLLDALEAELAGEQRGFEVNDAYAARVFDLWDVLQTAVRTLH